MCRDSVLHKFSAVPRLISTTIRLLTTVETRIGRPRFVVRVINLFVKISSNCSKIHIRIHKPYRHRPMKFLEERLENMGIGNRQFQFVIESTDSSHLTFGLRPAKYLSEKRN